MRCETCLLKSPEGETLPFETFLERLTACDECPLVVGPEASPAVCMLVAQHREAARVMRRQRAFANLVIDGSPTLIFVRDSEGRYLFANKATAELFGKPKEALLAERPSGDQGSADRMRDLRTDQEVIRSGRQIAFEESLVRPDGSLAWFYVVKTPLLEPDGAVRVLAIATDITERKRAEASQARLVTLLETTKDFVAIYDLNLRPQFLNRAARELLGVGLDEDISGRSISDFHTPKAVETLIHDALPHAIQEGSWLGDSALLASAGREIPISEAIIAHRDAHGGVDFFSTVGRDITVYKEVDRLKSEFISTVSHELRTPLTAIRGSLGLLEGGVVGPLPAEALEMVSIARANSDRLIRLINDILDLERMGDGKLTLKLSLISAAELIDVAIGELDGTARARGVRLMGRATRRLLVRGDRDRLIQVLDNLIANAIKFSPPGTEVRVVAARGPKCVRFYVRDRGQGIAQEDLDKLFRKFSQLDSSDQRAKSGSGLGLAICKAIVAQHGGTIGVTSELGKGATFYFDLPLEDEPSKA